MQLTLALHPDLRCEAVDIIEVDLVRSRGRALLLTYAARGAVADLLLPPQQAPERCDRLWEHTCFEIFVRSEGSDGYHEFNFAPSTQWAAYRFESRRSGMSDADFPAPRIETNFGEGFELRAALELSGLPPAPWQIGLSAVIEEKNGRKSYWALAHPPGEPDFHHPACFALELAPAA